MNYCPLLPLGKILSRKLRTVIFLIRTSDEHRKDAMPLHPSWNYVIFA